MKVSEVMNKVKVIDSSLKVRDAAKIISENNIGSLVVMKKEKILGIITEKDVTDNVSKLEKKVEEVMSKNIITINQDESLDEAARIMAKNKIKRLPVLEDDKLAGIITVTDIIANIEDLEEEFMFE